MIGMLNVVKKNSILFFISIVIAVVFLWSAVFLLPTQIAFSQITNSLVSILNLGRGQVLTQDHNLSLEGSHGMESLELRFVDINDSSNSKLAYAQRESSSTNFWHYDLDISELGNGNYRLETVAILLDGTVVAGETREFIVFEEEIPNLAVEITHPQPVDLLSGIYQFRAEVNQLVEEFYFKITDTLGLLRAYLTASLSGDLIYEISYNTLNVDDGEYYVAAEANVDGITFLSDQVLFYVANQFQATSTNGNNSNNQSTTSTDIIVNVFFTHPAAGSTASDRSLVQVKTSRQVDDVYFRIQSEFVNALEYDKDSWQVYINTREYDNGPLEIIAVASLNGSSFHSDILNLNVYNQPVLDSTSADSVDANENDNDNQSAVTNLKEKEDSTAGNSQTVDTEENNDNNLVADGEAADKRPVECKNIDISNITCDVYLRNKATLSEECIAKVIDLESCLRQEEQKNKCESLEFSDFNLCLRYLNEPRPSRWCHLADFKDQPVCLEYVTLKDGEVNENIINRSEAVELDKRCREQGIIKIDECQRFVEYLHLSDICKQQDIKTATDCKDFLQENYLDLACQRVGITDKDTCRDYFVLMSKAEMVCATDNCEQVVKDNFVPQLAARSVVDKAVSATLRKLANKNFKSTAKEPNQEIKDVIARLSVKYSSGQNFRIIATESKVRVEADVLLTVLPAAVVYDTDADGLPDDIELRLGSDINDPDTDKDGYLDGEEVLNGYDPLRPAQKLVRQLAPVEQALVSGKVFEQALVSGEVSDDISVKVANLEPLQVGDNIRSEKLFMSGIGPAFSVVTLYIYSDLPLLATVQVDEYGRWEYTLKDPLVDGEHQVFVAINDETGKIVKKSAGLLFFIKEARAVTAGEVIDLRLVDDSTILERYYLFGAAILVVLAGVSFIIVRRAIRGEDFEE